MREGIGLGCARSEKQGLGKDIEILDYTSIMLWSQSCCVEEELNCCWRTENELLTCLDS